MKRLLATVVSLAAITTGMIMYAPSPASAAWDASFSAKLVVESTHAAVAGVNVKAYTLTGGRMMAEAVSGPDGVFTLSGLRGGQYRLDFSKPGYHDTTLVGVWVTPHSTERLNTPIAMYPSNTKVPRVTANNRCGSLVNPNQVADVYVVCTGE